MVTKLHMPEKKGKKCFNKKAASHNLMFRFEPYSNYTGRSRDVAFWLPPGFSEMDFYDLVR